MDLASLVPADSGQGEIVEFSWPVLVEDQEPQQCEAGVWLLALHAGGLPRSQRGGDWASSQGSQRNSPFSGHLSTPDRSGSDRRVV